MVPKAPPTTEGIVIPIPTSDSKAEADRLFAETVPGWEQLDNDERAEIAELALALRQRGSPPRVTVVRDGNGKFSINMAGKSATLDTLRLHNTFVADSLDPVNTRASELIKYLDSVGGCTETRYNAALSFIDSMAPQSQAEVLLLIQMYVTHDAAIRALSQLGQAEWVQNMQMFGNMATKLLRTSQGQMETLARMRRGGEQVVRHIHVDNRGGQAVIAENINAGGRGNGKLDDQTHAAGSAGISAALLGADAFGSGVPIPGGEREASMQDGRGKQQRRAEGEP